MGFLIVGQLSHGVGQDTLSVPLCPTGQDVGRDSLNPLILNVSRWVKHRDKAHSCPEIPPFPFLRREGNGTGAGQLRVGGQS